MAASASLAAASTPGTRPHDAGFKDAVTPFASGSSLSPVLSDNGLISLSVDGLGTLSSTGGTINVQKPSGGTVRKALLLAASTGFSGYTPVDGDVTIDGQPVTWDPTHTIASQIGSVNVLADVTSLVKPKVDAAPAGLVPFTVAEPTQTANIDGEVLAVVLNDPTSPTSNTVTLLYGAQNPAGDTFPIALGTPIDKSNPNLDLTMGLGISFGFQVPTESDQFSEISVDSPLTSPPNLTSAAGGQDDCDQKFQPTPDYTQCGNGSLLTVGGLGDSTANPPDPTAQPNGACNPRCDDELYDLLPLVKNGDTSITVNSLNPSNNDNIFFGSLFFRGISALVGEGVLLTPSNATNPIGRSHTLTAKVQDSSGNPLPNTSVTFTVTAGPNKGVLGKATTNASGLATLSYTSSTTGTDTIVASFTDANGQPFTSAPVTKNWVRISAAGTSINGTEGKSLSAAVATFTDPITTDAASAFTATISWGDGTSSTGTISGSGGRFTVNGTHTYKEEGTYSVKVTITRVGDSVDTASATTTAHIKDAALHAQGVQPSVKGHTASGTVATFTDSNSFGTVSDFTATIKWGDGKSSKGKITKSNGKFKVSGSHTYAKHGTFTIKISIKDKGGSTASATTTVTITAHHVAHGTARLSGVPAACVLMPFDPTVTGKRILSVSWSLDGHGLKGKTVQSGKKYSSRASASPGSHHLTVKVKFAPSSHTKAKTFRRTVSGCPVVSPKFTG